MSFHNKSLTEIYGENPIPFTIEQLKTMWIHIPENFPSIDGSEKIWHIKKLLWDTPLLVIEVLRKIRKWKTPISENERKYIQNRISFIHDLLVQWGGISKKDIKSSMRDYQIKLIFQMLDFIFFKKESAGYIHSATSTGKMTMFWEIIRLIQNIDPSKKTLLTTPNNAALKRAKDEFNALWIPYEEFEVGKSVKLGLTIASIDKVRNAVQNDGIKSTDFDIMFCDEPHSKMLGSKTSKIMSFFQCKKIGSTATPELECKEVADLFPYIIGEYLRDEAVRDGYLPKTDDSISVTVPETEYKKLEKMWQDYSSESLGKINLEWIFPQIKELFEGRFKGKKFCIFLPNIRTSTLLSEYLVQSWIKSQHVDGTTKNIETEKSKFESWKTQILTCCDVLKESWDPDNIEGVMILRPTLSPRVYEQMLWRALHGKDLDEKWNKLPKKEVYVVDMVSNLHTILTRNITSRGLKTLMEAEKISDKDEENINTEWNEWTEELKWRAKIKEVNLWDLQYLHETLLYYDFNTTDFESFFYDILKQFANNSWESFEVVKQKVRKNPDIYSKNTKTVKIPMISNNVFWKRFAKREKFFQVPFNTFLRMIQLKQKSSSFKMFLGRSSEAIVKEENLKNLEKTISVRSIKESCLSPLKNTEILSIIWWDTYLDYLSDILYPKSWFEKMGFSRMVFKLSLRSHFLPIISNWEIKSHKELIEKAKIYINRSNNNLEEYYNNQISPILRNINTWFINNLDCQELSQILNHLEYTGTSEARFDSRETPFFIYWFSEFIDDLFESLWILWKIEEVNKKYETSTENFYWRSSWTSSGWILANSNFYPNESMYLKDISVDMIIADNLLKVKNRSIISLEELKDSIVSALNQRIADIQKSENDKKIVRNQIKTILDKKE